MTSIKSVAQAILVPEGAFMMGSQGLRGDEEPVHRVFISAFESAPTPVTRAEYRLYLDATG
ncbi:MAG: SUMF1/EgtB/PvdO family nonheme iron enzyme, partial [Vicinamibacteria bacterium]